ncbi:hypothetical protein PoB_006470100 [Plakobranchus ocellatus]|uniref:Uncharacterized protein n=1 Tax=Plakobranchus ocellatus TaxID=259542 RepID=A0AAV4D278_9GAST|nr:hypothetical protein PoB_006470100 [Plakobranchus ocellatus]
MSTSASAPSWRQSSVGELPLIPRWAPVMESWVTDITYPRNDFGRITCLQLIFLPGSSNLRYTMPLIFLKKAVLFPFRAAPWDEKSL